MQISSGCSSTNAPCSAASAISNVHAKVDQIATRVAQGADPNSDEQLAADVIALSTVKQEARANALVVGTADELLTDLLAQLRL